MTGESATHLAALIAAAKEGANLDLPNRHCSSVPPKIAPDLVLLAGGARLSVVFRGCLGRGITDGQHWAKLTPELVATLMAPTHAGYALSADLK